MAMEEIRMAKLSREEQARREGETYSTSPSGYPEMICSRLMKD